MSRFILLETRALIISADPSTALVNSVDNGVAYGMKYIEIYRKDIINLLDATHYAHIVLQSPRRVLSGKSRFARAHTRPSHVRCCVSRF